MRGEDRLKSRVNLPNQKKKRVLARTDCALVALPCQTDVAVQSENGRVILRWWLWRRVLLLALHAFWVGLILRAFLGLARFTHAPTAGNNIPLQRLPIMYGCVI
jgi:hypothetical protein